MRVFVVNSEDAKAVGEYINGHLNQVCAPVAVPLLLPRACSLSLSLFQYYCLTRALPRGTTQRGVTTRHTVNAAPMTV